MTSAQAHDAPPSQSECVWEACEFALIMASDRFETLRIVATEAFTRAEPLTKRLVARAPSPAAAPTRALAAARSGPRPAETAALIFHPLG
jgi:hypothetical protein